MLHPLLFLKILCIQVIQDQLVGQSENRTDIRLNKMDFKGIDAGGPLEEETTYLLGVGGELNYRFTNLAISLKGGLSKSGLKETYTNEFGEYVNPYGQALSFIEIGAYYRF